MRTESSLQIETKIPEELFICGAKGTPAINDSDHPQALQLCAAGHGSITVPLRLPKIGPLGEVTDDSTPQGAGLRSGTVWEWSGCCWDEGDPVAGWLSKIIGHPVRLVRFVGDQEVDTSELGVSERAVDPKYTDEHTVAFSDGYPFLLATEASRKRLEEEAGIPLTMERFRPNVIVDGRPAWQEDLWSEVAIQGAEGSVTLKLVKPCSRCTIPDVDPATGVPDKSKITSAALKALRTGDAMDSKAHSMHPKGGWQRKTYFGWNSVVQDLGVGYVSVGDQLKIVAER